MKILRVSARKRIEGAARIQPSELIMEYIYEYNLRQHFASMRIFKSEAELTKMGLWLDEHCARKFMFCRVDQTHWFPSAILFKDETDLLAFKLTFENYENSVAGQ